MTLWWQNRKLPPLRIWPWSQRPMNNVRMRTIWLNRHRP